MLCQTINKAVGSGGRNPVIDNQIRGRRSLEVSFESPENIRLGFLLPDKLFIH